MSDAVQSLSMVSSINVRFIHSIGNMSMRRLACDNQGLCLTTARSSLFKMLSAIESSRCSAVHCALTTRACIMKTQECRGVAAQTHCFVYVIYASLCDDFSASFAVF